MFIHLDPQFQPNTSGISIAFESFVFAGGEPHIKILSDIPQDEKVIITTRIHSFNDLGLLLVCEDALRRKGVQHLELILPYFPGARQDRIMVTGEPLTAKVYASIINQMGFRKVSIFDPHSDVSPALIENVEVVTHHRFIQEVISDINTPLLLVAPDAGAVKKIYPLAQTTGISEILECSKKRNVQNGQLSGFYVPAEDLQGKDCLIVDDICDGGGTFIGLAKELKAKNAGKLYLAVSHGIFSKGMEVLEAHFEMIYSTNSFQHGASRKLITMEAQFK